MSQTAADTTATPDAADRNPDTSFEAPTPGTPADEPAGGPAATPSGDPAGEPADTPGVPEQADTPAAPDEPGEGDDLEPDDEPEQPPAPPAAVVAGGPTAADIEQLERELARHWRAVGKIMGSDMDSFVDCPTCAEVGTPLAGRIPVWLLPQQPEFKTRTDTAMCDNCNGLGLMLTGSRVQGQDRLPCPTCSGAGYTITPAELPPPIVLQQPTAGPIDPRIAELRAAGYTVLDPFVPSA